MDSFKSSQGSNLAKRNNLGKPQYSRIDYTLFEEVVKVLESADSQYGRDNWKKGFPMTELIDSTMRHLFAFNSGEALDKSGFHHMAHAAANMIFILNNLKNHPNL